MFNPFQNLTEEQLIIAAEVILVALGPEERFNEIAEELDAADLHISEVYNEVQRAMSKEEGND